MKIDLSNISFDELCELRKALEKLPVEPQPVAPKFTKEEAETRFEVVNTILESLYKLYTLLDVDQDPPRLNHEDFGVDELLDVASSIFIDMDKFVRATLDEIDPIYFRSNPKGKAAAKTYALLAFANSYLIDKEDILNMNKAIHYLKMTEISSKEIRALGDEIYELCFVTQEWNDDLAEMAKEDFLEAMGL